MMKKSISTLLIFILAVTAFAQDKESLKKGANKLFNATCNLDFDAIFSETYPKVFEKVSKEQMKQMFNASMSNDDFSIQFDCVSPNFTFGEVKTINGQKFSIIEHNNQFQLKYKAALEEEEITNMIDLFNVMYEGGEVLYNKESKSFIFKVRSGILAIADELTNYQWKFINKDESNTLIKRIIDENTLKELGIIE